MPFQKVKLEKRFVEEYERLNEQQKLAVDTIEGPVMVIAGPGTGKTQILASRIGKILLETDTLPENILCLTYTEAGVVAMRKRLISFIGSDAYKVNIHTFHSFCNSVIQENIQLFNKKELEPLSDLERVQFIKHLIDDFDSENPLKRYKGEVYYDLENLATLFSAIKREGWETDWLIKKIDDYIENILPETDGFYNKREKKKGNPVLTQLGEKEKERLEKVKAAVLAFSGYQKILNENHRYDYDDMISWVIRMFEQHEDVLLGYQERLQYILVDEYQDTSGNQNKIVELLISYWADEKPNLFVVGDDDQSIYRFQGANLKNLTNLRDRFGKDLVKIVLTKNYRSVQPVLDAAKFLIENNTQRLAEHDKSLVKEFITGKEELKGLNILPVIRQYENDFCENAHIAFEIKKLVDRGVSPGRIAVIYREHKYGDEFLKFLQLKKIPIYIRRSVNLLEDIFINKILNFIRYTIAELDTPFSGESLLFEILHHDFFHIQPFRIASICNEIAGNRTTGPATLREYLLFLQQSQKDTLFAQDEETHELIKISTLLEALQKDIYNKPIQQWFEYLINEAGILEYVMNNDEKIGLMNKLSCLFDYIKEETHRNPQISLKQIMHSFELMRENGLSLELIQTTGNETGVNLLTSHGSKGLEFEYVFLIGARSDVWEGKKSPNKGFRLPPNVFELETSSEILEELRRLFFVSITRAEKYLYISYPKMTSKGKELIGSQFVEEIRDPMNLQTENLVLTETEKFEFTNLRFGIVQKPVLQEAEKEYIDRLLKSFVMNVTALNNYLDCPLRFYYNNLIRIPSAKSEAAEFGSAVHSALNDFLKWMMEKGKKYPEKDFLISRFAFHINKGREVFTKESLQRFTEHGKNILTKYYEHYYIPAPKGDFILTEYPLNKVVLNNIPLKGFADKIQFWGNDIVITDFKTGNFEKAKRRGEFFKPGENEDHPYGGNYWRQAVFYKLLVDNLPNKKWKVLHTQFDFVEPNKNDKFDIEKLAIPLEETEQVKKQITEVWEKIQRHDFYTGCGKPDCNWCNFAKNNKLYLRLEEEEPAEI
ncbi:MAG: ATP-dependent helicase [Bacteroidetes bacterium]|nr:ATP-dependent helicase [Bacteroidota bacterium]MBS1930930.1 ATP-dependent helicase [Bacteroidota bacterium]